MGRMLNMIKSMYQKTYYSAKCQDGSKAFFKSTTGVRQGRNPSLQQVTTYLNQCAKGGEKTK